MRFGFPNEGLITTLNETIAPALRDAPEKSPFVVADGEVGKVHSRMRQALLIVNLERFNQTLRA